MKYALIYKSHFHRTRSMAIEAESREAISVDLDPEQFLVEHLIDFDERTITPVILKGDGGLFEIPDGEFGEATTAEYFENEAGTMELTGDTEDAI